MTKMDYDKNRTDDIELLFKAIYYAELVEKTDTQVKALRKRLSKEFKQFPVEFDKEKRAFRYAAPYKYHENGKVTISVSDNNHYILLDTWEPANRPVPKDKPKRKVQPNYNALLHVSPIWYLQVMNYKGRKTTRHRSGGYYNNPVSTYLHEFKQNLILRQLPDNEKTQFLTARRDFDMSRELSSALRTFEIHLYAFYRLEREIENGAFFFLNDAEIELLAKAIELDNPGARFDSRYRTSTHTNTALQQIMQSRPDERVSINVNAHVKQTRDITLSQRGHEFTHEILDHETIWRNLHAHYTELNDNQLDTLRGFDMLDDELLEQIKRIQKENEVLA